MRKWVVLLVIMCLMAGLCACAGEKVPELTFRGIAWNADFETVSAALGLDPEALDRSEIHSTPYSAHFTVTVQDWEVFGQEAVSARFRFDNFTPGLSRHFGLSGVQIFYSMDCDREVILENLRREYGPEAREYTMYRMTGGQLREWQYTWEEGNFSWFSRTLTGDALSDEEKAFYRRVLGDVSDENFERRMSAPVARIRWVEDYYSLFESPQDLMTDAGPVSWLNLSGDTLVHLIQQIEGRE